MRVAFALMAAGILTLSLPASAHLFNHQTRHEDCQIYVDPHDTAIDDGHVHFHHLGAAPTAHYHGNVLYPAGHTHQDVMHDPCDQVGLKAPTFVNMPAITEVSVDDAALGNIPVGTSAVIVRDPANPQDAASIHEAYALPVAGFTEVENLILHGDASLVAAGLPGDGSVANPYIVQGYIVRNILDIKDTSKCIVVRYNVIQGSTINTPLLDVADIIDRQQLVADAQAALAAAVADLTDLQGQLADLQAQVDALEATRLDLAAAQDAAADDLATAQHDLTRAQAELAQAQADNEVLEDQRAILLDEEASLQDQIADLQAESDQLTADGAAAQAATEAAAQVLADAQQVLADEQDALARLQEQDAQQAALPVSVPVVPSGLSGLALGVAEAVVASLTTTNDAGDPAGLLAQQELLAQIADQQQVVAAAQAALAAAQSDGAIIADDVASTTAMLAGAQASLVTNYAQQQAMGPGPDMESLQGAVEIALHEVAVAEHALADAQEAVQEQELSEAPLLAEYSNTLSAIADLLQQVQDLENAVMDAVEALAVGNFEYLGFAFDTLDEVVDHVLEAAQDAIDPDDAGRAIFDWNGQCLHVYDNVVQDLRVNRNNARTGYATGGVIEDNRIGEVGQIRHYDGVFRENEVGDRRHLTLFGQTDAPASTLAMNVDGFNEGVFRDNTVYGHIELDLHGHHHGPGFFARESHYHGSDDLVGYMQNPGGGFMLDANGNMIPHHDHTKRWTSSVFEGNLVVDPLGYGVRYDDENHAGDDRTAASEDMQELLKPHFHRTFVTIDENDIVGGGLWVDIFNADGIEIWSDDYSVVRRDPVTLAVLDAVLHLGAERINSHPQANTGWLDVTDNELFTMDKAAGIGGYAWSALQFNDMKEVSGRITGNTAFVVPDMPDTGMDAQALRQYLVSARYQAPSQIQADLSQWGELDPTGMPTVGILVRGLKDAALTVCGNTFAGFDVGLEATQNVLTSSTIGIACGNDFGGAAADIVYSPVPNPGPGLTQPVRDIVQGSVLAPILEPIYEEVDETAADLVAAAQGTPVGAVVLPAAAPVVQAVQDVAYAVPDGQTVPVEQQVGQTLSQLGGGLQATPLAPVGHTLSDLGHRLQ